MGQIVSPWVPTVFFLWKDSGRMPYTCKDSPVYGEKAQNWEERGGDVYWNGWGGSLHTPSLPSLLCTHHHRSFLPLLPFTLFHGWLYTALEHGHLEGRNWALYIYSDLPQSLAQGFAHRRCSINVIWICSREFKVKSKAKSTHKDHNNQRGSDVCRGWKQTRG